jgi:hypothetical protein
MNQSGRKPDYNNRAFFNFQENQTMTALKKLTGIALAAAAAGMFVTAGIGSAFAAEDGKIHCEGVNACKGKSDCKTAKNACKGQNACKGNGYLELSEKDCNAAKAKAKKS